MITQKELLKLFHYDPITGIFTRLTRPSTRVHIGDKVGSDTGHGYLETNINGKKYYMHRLAWLYVYGKLPSNTIDHINGDGTDNRLSNIRNVTHKENMMNRKNSANNSSGFVGVTWNKASKKWMAYIKASGKCEYLGCYLNKSDAVKARVDAEIEVGFHNNHGR